MERSRKYQENFHKITPWIPEGDKPPVIINDITLRDGKQALPWWNLWTNQEAIQFVDLLEKAGIHHVEAGFAAIPGDPETQSVFEIVQAMKNRDIMIFSLARLIRSDIETAIKTLEDAKYKGIHTFIGTSPEHLKSRNMSYEQVKTGVREAIKLIVDAGFICEFSPEDATRSDYPFMRDVLGEAANQGAHIFNIPDTLGYADMEEYASLMKKVEKDFPHIVKSTHTHNDWNLADANTLIAVKHGLAQRIEGTVMGIGERAGNMDWPNLEMGAVARTKHDRKSYRPSFYYQFPSEKILKNPDGVRAVVKHFEAMSGIHQRPVAPSYGYEAQMNRSGIHQAEVRKLKESYLWQIPEHFGFDRRPRFDVTPLSGKGGVQEVLFSIGIESDDAVAIQMTDFYRRLFTPDISVEELTHQFKNINRDDLENLRQEIDLIRKEARTLKNTEDNMKKWLSQTDDILDRAFFIVNPDYQFGPYQLDEFEYVGKGKSLNGSRDYSARVVVNGEEQSAQALGEVEAVVFALKKAAHKQGFDYHPNAVIPLSDKPDALASMKGMMEDRFGNRVDIYVRDRSTTTTHVKAFMRGINKLAVLKRYQEKLKAMDQTE